MVDKNQLIVFVISFLAVGFYLLSTPESGFSGPVPGGPPCCQFTSFTTCSTDIPRSVCEGMDGEFFANGICPDTDALCVVPQIPTLNQWGKIITMVVIGLFAAIGIFAIRRRSVLKPH